MSARLEQKINAVRDGHRKRLEECEEQIQIQERQLSELEARTLPAGVWLLMLFVGAVNICATAAEHWPI